MNQVKLKITFGEILIFMLFVSIFRPYFLPSTVYQMIKVIVVGIAFIFLIAKAKGILINWINTCVYKHNSFLFYKFLYDIICDSKTSP